MDETKRQSPTYHLMELSLWPYLSIQHCCLLGSILNYRGRKQIVDDHFSTAPDCCQRWPALTEDSPRNINTASASSSASDGVLQQDHRGWYSSLHSLNYHAPRTGTVGTMTVAADQLTAMAARPTAPYCPYGWPWPLGGGAIGLYRPLSPPIVHRCSPWWLLVDSGLLLHPLVYFSEKWFLKKIMNWPTTTKTQNTVLSR